MYVCNGELLKVTISHGLQFSSFRRYLSSAENWLEVCLVVIVAIIIYVPDETMEDGCNAKRCLAAIAILLSWAGKVFY
jgi:hypothetical protein